VDRIGQKSDTIRCYSFLPAEGVERIIRLRARVRQRLQENAEVVGTDEAFFEDDRNDQAIRDLFTEKAGILDGDADTEVDLGILCVPDLEEGYRPGSLASEDHPGFTQCRLLHQAPLSTDEEPEGVLVYVRTAQGNDALAWVNQGRQEHHRVPVRHPQSGRVWP